MRRKEKGVITVFFSLILLTIFALIGTTIEIARFNIAKGFSERALITSINSLLSDYYLPVFKKYNIFMLDTGYGEGIANDDKLSQLIEESMNYTFNPIKDLKKIIGKGDVPNVNLYNIKAKDIAITKKIKITDENGKIFYKEVIDYMKYSSSTKVIEDLLIKLSIIKKAKSTSKLVEEKFKVEESTAEFSRYMLELMKVIDGVATNKNGIKQTYNGKLQIENSFVKKLISSKSKDNIGIDNNIVYKSVISHVVDMNEKLNIISTEAKSVVENIKIINEIIKEEIKYEEYESKEVNFLKDDYSTKNEEEASKKAKFAEEKEKLRKERERLEEDNKNSFSNIKKAKEILLEAETKSKAAIELALKTLNAIEEKQKLIDVDIRNYNTKLENEKDNVDSEVYKSLKEDSKNLKKDIEILDTNKLGTILKNNKKSIENLEVLNTIATNEEDVVELEKLILEVKALRKESRNYNTKDLKLKYGDISVKEKPKNPIIYLQKLITNGVLILLFDDVDKLSNRIIDDTAELPSQLLEDKTEEKDNKEKSSINEDNIEKDNTGILEKLLFHEYITSYFKNVITASNQEKKMVSSLANESDTALNYEQEYIIAGKNEDKENLSEVINKILLTRTVFNFVYLITDTTKREIAYTTALGLVGITGIEPLVRLTQSIILLVWSYDESLIDMKALLENKSVPFFKTRQSFIMKYEELFCVTNNFIKEKAKKYKSAEENKLDFSYKDYINLFLMMLSVEEKSYRALDIIQENIKISEDKDFLVSNCIFGIRVKSDYSIAAKFLRIPFIAKEVDFTKEEYEYSIERESSY